ncbi:uncharacterized protein J4E88_009965 [Alternaria novae-zelandiae]|uniref:uncharacterized protein n=1 Tax=Alternaria novae-zelandiae TaxID=430562 RepID=UPI0020C204A2|nr:uncharacterized protein J4E88_009965 [Alternaria novae-zelandiae]KAI4669683.1 hypothetical protein J4E88_009965 [Alternaria novae-zelandiae]
MAPKRAPRPKGDQDPNDTTADAQERVQAIAAITTNWGQAFSSMQHWMHDNTWLKGETEKLSEQTCEMDTIRAFRTLSQSTRNWGQQVKDQIQQYYLLRWNNPTKKTPIGTTKEEKEKNLREDLAKLRAGRFIPEANWKENKTKRPRVGEIGGKKAKPKKKSKKDVSREERDEDEEEDEPHPPPNPKPATKPANTGAVNEIRRRLRSHGNNVAEGGAAQTEKQKNNVNQADDDAAGSELLQAKSIHTPEDKDMALIRIHKNWDIVSLHRDFPAMLRGADPNAANDNGIEDVIIELLRDLSIVSATKEQANEIRAELQRRFDEMEGYDLKAVHSAITVTAQGYYEAAEAAKELSEQGSQITDVDEQVPRSEISHEDGQGPRPEVARPEAAPPAARPDRHRHYAARSNEASLEMQEAWDAVVVAEAAVKVAQDKRVRAALRSETEYQQATRQLRVSEAQLRAAEEYARARSLGRPQKVGETVGPGGDERTRRRSGDGGDVVEEREQNREGGAGEGGDDEAGAREGEGNGEGDENGGAT